MKLAPGIRSADGLAHGLGAEQQRLLLPARVQQAVGEDVAALGVGRQLHLVDGEEVDVDLARHRLDRAHPVARPLRLDLLLAGDRAPRASAPTRGRRPCRRPRAPAGAAAGRSGPMSWPSMRSIARCVLPVLVGPEHGGHVADAAARSRLIGKALESASECRRHCRVMRQDQGARAKKPHGDRAPRCVQHPDSPCADTSIASTRGQAM